MYLFVGSLISENGVWVYLYYLSYFFRVVKGVSGRKVNGLSDSLRASALAVRLLRHNLEWGDRFEARDATFDSFQLALGEVQT